MYTLFYKPGACSLAVHVLLNELNAPCTLVKADFENKQSEFWKANPRGKVPTLVVDGKPLTEGAAILTYLCENHDSALLPELGWERAKAQEWLAFANATLHPTYARAFMLKKTLGEEAAKSPLMEMTVKSIQGYWAEIERELAGKSYICGNEMTVGDILLSVIANWSGNVSPAISFGEKTKAWLQRIVARPAYQKALAAEHVDYKAAA